MNDKAFCPVCKQSDLSHPAHTFRCAEIIELWKERDALRKQLDVAKEAIDHVLKHPLTRYHEVEEYWMITILNDALAEIEKIGGEK